MIIESVTLNSNSKLTTINDYAFRNCINLKEIQLPKSLENINFKKVFENCTEVKIEIEDENEYLISNKGVLFNQNKSELIQYPIRKAKNKLYNSKSNRNNKNRIINKLL